MVERIRVVCGACKAAFLVRGDAHPGSMLPCPKCGGTMTVPQPEHFRASSGSPTLAGSPDDRQVTLAQDAPTLTLPDAAAREAAAPPSEEETVLLALQPSDEAPGRYVYQGEIGRGGMGEVLLVIDRDARRQVALKRILPDAAADPARRARFVEEAQVTAQLEHPNIVPVHEVAREPDGSLYYTMKLVKGRSLAEIVAEMKKRDAGEPPLGKGGFPRTPSPKPSERVTQESLEGGSGEHLSSERCPPLLSLSDLLQVFLKVCDGVAFAHSRGVMHRDLKPSNIMVGHYGEVLVMDWGLAKILGGADSGRDHVAQPPSAVPAQAGAPVPHDPASAAKGTTDRVRTDRREEGLSPTLDGSAIGTPAYMSPEQARGELDKLDPRSDIWSLGAILYEILTFERAIEGATPMMALANAAKGRVLPPEQRAPSRFIPRELSAIAMKCLHKVRSRRYPTVLDLKRDISLFLEGRSVSAAPDTFGQAVVKLVKRNRGTSASIATAAAILIAVTVAFLLRLKGERDHALASEARALRGEQAAVVAQQRQRATALEASEALARQAVRAAEEGRLAEAEVRADAALRVLPDGPWGHYALAILALEKKDLASARRLLDAALSSDPTHGPSSAAMAQLGLAEGKIAEAASLLKRVEEVKDWRSLLAAGNVFMSAQSSPMR